jgi:catechol 2,3-dioxygenase-like lactoylglutathione lyase family enzyme
MLDHISLPVSDIERSKHFYEEALSPLGYELIMEHGISGVGFGHAGKPDFWIKWSAPSVAVHVAFASLDRGTVDAYYDAAIAAGGRHKGWPGPRPEYHPTYYGAFVLDLDGNNIEGVCHGPEREA